MICDEAAEHISALYDGETIPRHAAEHIGECEGCRAQLKDYMEIGAEMRRVASLEAPVETPRVVWDERAKATNRWWQRGWERMSIPRLVFGSLVLAVVGLASSLAVVGVRANTQGTVLMLKIRTGAGEPIPCGLSMENKKNAMCGLVSGVKGGMLIYKIQLLAQDGDRVELGVQSKFGPVGAGSRSYSLSEVDDLPQQQYWFQAGETVQIDVAGFGTMAVTGEWMDHMPPFMAGNRDVDPGPGELRISSPLLLRANKLVGDMEGGNASTDERGEGVMVYLPGQGRFIISLSPMDGAVPATAKLNRISFEIDSVSYVLVTGTPITRNEAAWVRLEPNYRPPAGQGDYGFIGSLDLNSLAKQSPDEH